VVVDIRRPATFQSIDKSIAEGAGSDGSISFPNDQFPK